MGKNIAIAGVTGAVGQEFLRIIEDFRRQLYVTGLVHPVHVSERGGDSEPGTYLEQFLIGIGYMLRLGL